MRVYMAWRAAPSRIAAFNRVHAWWTEAGFEVVTVDSGHAMFNVAATRNRAVEMAEQNGDRIVIICDADTHPADATLFRNAVLEAERDPNVVHLPYRVYSVRSLDGTIIAEFDWSVSGVLLTTPQAWWSIGGQDERFTKWAPEDFAMARAHETILGQGMVRHDGTVIAYHHEPAPNRIEDGDGLAEHYAQYEQLADLCDREGMLRLVEGNR